MLMVLTANLGKLSIVLPGWLVHLYEDLCDCSAIIRIKFFDYFAIARTSLQ